MTRSIGRLLFAVALALAVMSPASFSSAAPSAGAAARQPTVVELFTSQGCASCPPADVFLGELAERKDVLPLSFNVDYWDYIGWKDTLARPANTRRQRAYADKLGLHYVYTPQMVVQGAFHATGSDRAAVLGEIQRARGLDRLAVSLSHVAPGVVSVAVAAAPAPEEAAIWLVVFERARAVPVKRGENRGRTLKYHNVVRGLKRIATFRGEALKLSASLPETPGGVGEGCAVLIQSETTGRILGAAVVALNR